MKVNTKKIEAIQNLPYPKTKKQVQRALGGFSWWRNFIKNFAEKAKGLTDTLRGEKFVMTEEAKNSFNLLKQELCNPPILIYADLTKEMLVYTDCSLVAMGGVLGQEIDGQFHAIAYGSKVLTPTQQAYPSFKREFLALKHFIELWRPFLLHKPFTCYVDAISICGEGFLKKTTSAVMLRWMIKLSEYEFKIKYRPGAQMELPDMLSRAIPLPEKSEQLFDWYVQNSGLTDKNLKKEDFMEELVGTVKVDIEEQKQAEEESQSEETKDQHSSLDLERGKVKNLCPYSNPIPKKKRYQQGHEIEKRKHTKTEEIQEEGTFDLPIPAKRDQEDYWHKAQSNDDDLQVVTEWLRTSFVPPRRMANNFTEIRRKLWNQLDRLYINQEALVCFKYYNTNVKKYTALIVVPKGHTIKVMYQYHSTPLAGHMGYTSTLNNIRKSYYWPKMSTEVKLYCQNCAICEINNLKYLKKPRAPLKSFPAHRINQMVSLDIVGPFTHKSQKFKYILTIMDRFSRYCAAAALRTQTSKEIARNLLSKWIFRMGVPETMLSDQGANLSLSAIMQDLYKVLGINKVRTTAYHPACNGALERRHKDLVNVLKKLVGDSPNNWQDHLDIALFALNSAVCASTGYSPHELVFSYQVRVPADLVFSVTTTQHYKNGAHLKSENYYKFKEIFDIVRSNIDTSMKLQKRTYDRQTNFTKYKIGDRVLVYRPVPAQVKEWRKFKNTFIGPFEIQKVISEHNYLVEHVDTKKQMVVHFDSLRFLRTIQKEPENAENQKSKIDKERKDTLNEEEEKWSQQEEEEDSVNEEEKRRHQEEEEDSVNEEENWRHQEEEEDLVNEEEEWSLIEEKEEIKKEFLNGTLRGGRLETIPEDEEGEPSLGYHVELNEPELVEETGRDLVGGEVEQSTGDNLDRDRDTEEVISIHGGNGDQEDLQAEISEEEPEGEEEEAQSGDDRDESQEASAEVNSGRGTGEVQEASRKSSRTKREPARFADEQNKYYGPK